MTSQVSTKVRLVRCPKCRQVLAELPEVPLYQCGGCGTVLQAKSRRPETSSTEPSSHETDSVAKTQKDDVSETSSSNKEFATRPEAESLSDKGNITHHDENGNSAELSEGRSVLSSSPEAACPQIEDLSIEAKDFSKCDSSGEISKRYLHDDNDESGRGTNFSDELPSSGELALEAELYHTEQHNNDQMWQKGDDFVPTVHNSPEHEYPESVLSPEGENDNRVSPENDDKSVSRENESTEKNTIASVCDSKVASRSPSKESLVSFYLMSSDNEQHLDRSPTEGNFGRLASLDTLGSSFPPTTNNYPKTQSYYAYDGSESSYDGNDDRICERITQPGLRKTDVGPTEMLRNKNGFRANSEPEWAPTSSSHRATRNNHWNLGKSTEIDRYATGNRTRLAGPGPESYRHSSLPPRPVFKPPYPEPDNIDLLRTVCELKDQLNRMHFQYDRFSPGTEMYSDARRPTGYNLRHNNNNQPRLAFSGESARYGPHVSCSCLHCRPQDWRYSAQLPQHSAHRKNGPYGAHADLGPQRYASSEASLWGYETKPDNQSHGDEIIKRARLKEKYFAGKRHLRPVAGGAPVVVCYHCSELLHLPADFLLFKKKYHRLMCDACKKVLRFSVRKGTHIVPYIPGALVPPPPPNEVSRRNAEPVSRAGSIRRADRPVSCSDDYYNGNMSSGSSFEAVEDRKMKSVLVEPRDEDEGLMRADESAGPSSKWRKGNSEIEEASSSPLHRLMGYSSPSQVLDV
ncbi:uncharacterized protein at5g05190 [Phtheirospermum japonicum]|uniref:Uncharacterized protein at5g05190 n=1 Tax=Phtheirospermum japonicum TaxID=374723 RepID=A0A830BP42_9LAMI|nr:uncharacterized protein at5g05190 [Phtheirospermum japonicum]